MSSTFNKAVSGQNTINPPLGFFIISSAHLFISEIPSLDFILLISVCISDSYVFFEELGDETCIAEQVSRLTGRFSRRTSVQLEEMGYLIQKEHAKI